MKPFFRVAVALTAVILAAGACTTTPPSGTGGGPGAQAWTVDPSAADPATTADSSAPNAVFLPTVAARGELAVMLHGTGSIPIAHGELAATLRADGYHVILLRYSASLGTIGACPDANAATYPDCHRDFRSETTFGAGVPDPDGFARDHAIANISGADSVVNRLLKLVDHMDTVAPTAGFDSFQQSTGGACDVVNPNYGACELDWSKVSFLGHSQGAGVALYMAKHFPLKAAGLTSGTYDAYNLGGGVATAAPWTTENDFETPATSIRTLMHNADYGAVRIRAVADAVGIPGPEVSATVTPFLSNRLVTSAASTCPWDAVPGHNSTSVDLCTPNGLYAQAWRYLAGS